MDETKLGKYKVLYTDNKEYHTLKREIWGEDIYYFDTEKENPLIIDIGSHIGISVLYFKSIYPNSQIIAFEPNPYSFEILKENVSMNNLCNVSLINKAVHSHSGIKDFYIPMDNEYWSSNSAFISGSWTGKERMKKISVESTTLNEYMDRDIDMLKIDIEGSELSILKEHKKILDKVQNICVEYHPVKNSKPEDLLNILKPIFDIEIYREGKICRKFPKDRLLTIKGKKSK
jgi:FkbM family methyltransferase